LALFFNKIFNPIKFKGEVMKRPEIKYPCKWTYKIIGKDKDENTLRSEIEKAMGNKKYDLSLSRKSSKGKYISFTMETVVDTENQRNERYIQLAQCSNVVRVL
jgi:putative lipoic acid-binding regulatory protein